MSLLVFETEEDEAADLYNKKEGHKVVLFRGTVHDVAGYPAGEDILANDLGSNIEEKAKEAKHTKAVKPIFKDLPVVGRLKLTQSTSSRKGRHVITKGKAVRIDGSRINRKLDFGYGGPGTLFNHNNLATICTAVGTNYRTPPSPYYCPPSEEKICIKIHNDWYDISKFAPYHPGGQVIYEYAGCDATEVFTAFHVHQDSKILKWLKKIPPQEIENSNLIRNEGAAAKEAIDLKFSKDMDDMIQKMKDDGLFKPNLYYMVLKILLTAFFFFAGWHQTFQATRRARHLNLDSEIDWKQLTFAAALITLFIQQSGFLLHDFMHNNWFHNRRIDQGFGRFFGSICMGISGLWWRDEHWIHHIFTNTYEHGKRILDVQMAEDVWAQDPNLLQFFDGSLPQSIWARHMNGLPLWLSEKIIQYQSFLWLPLSIFLGRLAIFLTSFKKCQNMTERILQVIHVIWFCAFLYSCFPSWKSALSFYFLVNVGEGIFHVQLLVNHYLKPWHDLSETKTSNSWYRKQVMSTVNISPFFSTRWLRNFDSKILDRWDDYYAPLLDDWFHGGLNLHIEHHTMPKLPRHSLREANRRLQHVCRRNGIYFDERHFLQAVWDTLVHMSEVSQKANFSSSMKHN